MTRKEFAEKLEELILFADRQNSTTWRLIARELDQAKFTLENVP